MSASPRPEGRSGVEGQNRVTSLLNQQLSNFRNAVRNGHGNTEWGLASAVCLAAIPTSFIPIPVLREVLLGAEIVVAASLFAVGGIRRAAHFISNRFK